MTKFTVVIPIEFIPGQKLLSEICPLELLIKHYSEITEPVILFWYGNLKYGSGTRIIAL